MVLIGEWRTGQGWIAGRYCPLCDVAILFHQDADGGPWVHAFWRRSAESWAIAEQCRESLSFIERRGHGRWRQRLWDEIAKFLAERAEPDLMRPLYCRNDGSRIPEKFRTQYGGVQFQYSWCAYCKAAFCSVFDPVYGWEDLATLAWLPDQRQFVVRETHPVYSGLVYREEWLCDLPAP